jgi:arsenical pump membrane protein
MYGSLSEAASAGVAQDILALSAIWVWTIVVVSIAGILIRPGKWPEAIWACLGAALLVVTGLLPISLAAAGVAKGTDVYLFLTGMMLLAELARREGVFDWLAALAVRAARGSRTRLFTLVYLVGTLVTVFLSNDATAVVLTPAVYAAVKKARVTALPYLFVCAFIANAASFVLPIANPANLVVYGKSLPALATWLRLFLVPSILSIGATYAVLRFLSRSDLEGGMESLGIAELTGDGRRAVWGIAITGVVLIGVSSFGLDLGVATLVSAIGATLLTTKASLDRVREIAAGVAWSVLPLVAGLFVLVEALDGVGALQDVGMVLRRFAQLPPMATSLSSSFAVAALSNVMNNLPSGLLVGGALGTVQVPAYLRPAVLIGVDLGPNLSVTGSLATILWLIALRREGEHVSGWTFLKTGALVMLPALFLATLVIPWTAQ